MRLVPWEPLREPASLQSELNRLFEGFAGVRGGNGNGHARRYVPAMDLVAKDDELVLRADLPGLSEDDVSIEVDDGVLTVSGERHTEREEEAKGYHRFERNYGKFSRSLALPDGVDAERVEASFERGVLEVRIPKPEQRKPHKAAIAAGSIDGDATERD